MKYYNWAPTWQTTSNGGPMEQLRLPCATIAGGNRSYRGEATMLLATRGLLIRTLEESEAYLREFIWETLRDPNGSMQRHSHDYDLYLPWVHEEIRNAPPPPNCEVHGAVFVDVLKRSGARSKWSDPRHGTGEIRHLAIDAR